MKILFLGNVTELHGPDQVNRCYYSHLSEHFLYARSRNRYAEFIEAALKMLFCRVVVVSGVTRRGCWLTGLARFFRKKTVYIMHGCAAHEFELNRIVLGETAKRQEMYMLKNADLLLPVSEKFMHWVQQRYPEYAHKTHFLYNGIEKISIPENDQLLKVPGSIIAAGGTDPLKGNGLLAQAVEQIPEAHLRIYGNQNGTAGSRCGSNVQYMGRVSHEEFLQQLMRTELFVVNSVFETFSLAAVEALSCGCSVLISEQAGVTGILELSEADIIHNPEDIGEIKCKVEHLLMHANHQRIMSKLNLDAYSYPKTVERLETICQQLCLTR